MSALRWAVLALAGASLAACAGGPRPLPPAATTMGTTGTHGTMRPYEVGGVWYTPQAQPGYDQVGLASWYGPQSSYHTTADGEAFDPARATAAHKTLPLPCIVEVTNLDNGKSARLRVNDRGPFVPGRIIDVSRKGAEELGFLGRGVARVRVRYVGPAPVETARARPYAPPPRARAVEYASYAPPSANAPTMASYETATPYAPPQPAQSYAPEPAASSPAMGPAPGVARMQAATFGVRANADRAAAALAEAGDAQIEPTGDAARPLWRVIVTARAGESAEDLRARVAAAGFPSAVSLEP